MIETELKYTIPEKSIAECIWNDPKLIEIEDAESRETLSFKAAYFDTECRVLASNDIAFRVRLEGSRVVATLKWNGVSEGALHTREEINVPIDGEACLILPDPEIFKESDMGQRVIELISGKPLISTMETRFLRRRVRVDTGESIIEVSIDIGDIVVDSGSQPICELELELFSGSRNDLLRLGEELSMRYSLFPESKSKYARGLLLTGRMPD